VQNYREIHRLRKDALALRTLAKRLLAAPGSDWTDWEIDFLEDMSRHAGPDLTTRQGEKLIELRDDAENHASWHGLSVRILAQKCSLACDELEPPDAAFVQKLEASGATAVKRRQLFCLLRCARQLKLIEPYMLATPA
jgi:hypothetical protein